MNDFEYHIVLRRSDDDTYDVWLDEGTEDEPGANALILGGGATRDLALQKAKIELEQALERVNRALQQRVQVLR